MMAWLTENWQVIVQAVSAFLVFANIVTGLFDTPDPTDTPSKIRGVIAKLQGLLARFSLVTHPSSKGTFKLPGS